MTWGRKTAWFILVILIVIAVWDTFAMLKAGAPASITYFMRTEGQQYPVIPFLWGCITGHFWLT